MKIKHLFYLLLALPLAFAACEEPIIGPTPGEQDTVLTLTSKPTMEFTAEGGEGVITYTLENANSATSLTAACEDGWITNLTVDENITFTVEANVGEARETTIVVAYGDLSFEVAVKQAEVVVDAKEYLYDEELAYAERVSLAEYGFPDNYFLIGFYTEDGNILLGAVLVGETGEEVLSAGTYTVENGGLMIEGFELYVGETEEYFFEGGDGEVVVEGDIEGYTFDIEISNVEGQNFHFTYEGVVEDMQLPTNVLPTEPVNFTAEHLDGEYYGTDYSVAHNYYVLLSDLGLDEDGYSMPGGTYYQVDLYSVEGTVDADGYIHIPAGTYAFDVDDNGTEWTLGNYYSGYFKINADGTAYEGKGTYEAGQAVVNENGITLTVTVGGVEHTVTYNGEPKLYVGGGETPAPEEDVEFTANYAYAMYFGDQYTPGTADNYYFFLSDLGIDEEGYDIANGAYYRFDLYAPISSDHTIAPGTYPIDNNDTCDCWTVSAYYSAYYKMNSYGDDYDTTDWPDGGFITFNEDGSIYAEVHMMVSGATHKITFAGGDIVIYDSSDGGGDDYGDILSTLWEDYTCNFDNHTLYYEFYGDYYEIGLNNWTFAIMPNDGVGDFVQFDVLTDATNTTSFAGTFAISSSFGSFTSYPGYIDDWGDEYYMSGSWYYTNDGVTMAPFVDGSVYVTDNGDGTAKVSFEVLDDADNCIDGEWSGKMAPASELESVTRSSSMKQLKSIVVNEAAAPVVSKERVAVKSVKKASTAAPAKGLKLR
jgi:hypothetical protein